MCLLQCLLQGLHKSRLICRQLSPKDSVEDLSQVPAGVPSAVPIILPPVVPLEDVAQVPETVEPAQGPAQVPATVPAQVPATCNVPSTVLGPTQVSAGIPPTVPPAGPTQPPAVLNDTVPTPEVPYSIPPPPGLPTYSLAESTAVKTIAGTKRKYTRRSKVPAAQVSVEGLCDRPQTRWQRRHLTASLPSRVAHNVELVMCNTLKEVHKSMRMHGWAILRDITSVYHHSAISMYTIVARVHRPIRNRRRFGGRV
jgi:hypothetical protein